MPQSDRAPTVPPSPLPGSEEHPTRSEIFLRTPRGILVGCLACTVTIALLNRVGSLFQVPAGIALVFPAPAISSLAGVLFGWWGVLASFVGYQLLPWGLSTTIPRAAFFAAAASLEAAVPAVARLRPQGLTLARTLRVVIFGVVLNSLASSLAGVPMVVHLSEPPMTPQQVAFAFAGWFFGDVMTMAILTLPLLVVVAPGILMRPAHAALARQCARRRWLLAATAISSVLIAAGMQLLYTRWGISPHWVSVFFVMPILICAATGGLGGALLANGVVGVLYVAQILRVAPLGAQSGFFSAMFSTYWNLGLFTVMAVTAGLYAGRTHVLLDDLRKHQRLLQESFNDAVTALAAAIEAKDKGTEGHVQRVAEIAVDLGRRLGIEGRRLDLLRYAAILHDVGKIGIPEEILNKPGGLTPSEREVVKRHVTVGVEILEGVRLLSPAIPFIRYHQERWDGLTEATYPGYFGLKGTEIPAEARIIAVVDAFDAMTSDRPYRAAQSPMVALEELRREAGKQFDPEVVQALVELFREQGQPVPGGRESLPQAS